MYVIWASPYMIKMLRSVTSNDQLHVDGTFKVIPEKIAQLLVVSVRFKGAFMDDK